MRVRAWLAAVAIFAMTVAASSGFSVAQTGGAFKVVGVPIDQTAESAAAARTLALAAGQQEAYRRLVRRLALLGDIGTAPAASPALLREIVSGIAVESEKTSSVRYLASLTVDFDPAAVRKRFLAAGLRWAETQSKPLVVLPVFRTQGTVQLWDRTNIWHQTWRDAPESDGLIRLIVPPGETSDLAAISPRKRCQETRRGFPSSPNSTVPAARCCWPRRFLPNRAPATCWLFRSTDSVRPVRTGRRREALQRIPIPPYLN